jgi:uncharacterized protein (DUF1501 family)
MTASRRLFLTNGAITLAALGASSLWRPGLFGRVALAADSARRANSKKVLICVFQRGAADGLSMVVPHGDPFYYKYRQEIALARPTRASETGAAPDLDGFFALHPAMSALLPLYKAGHLAVIHACGSPNSSRSHFDMQDFMESGVPDDKSVHTGWLNRALAAKAEARANPFRVNPFRAVAMSSLVPRTLQGDVEALAIRDLNTFGVNATGGASGNLASGFEGMYDGAVDGVLHGAGKESFNAIALLKKANPAQYTPAHGAVYPPGAFGKAILQVAQLIKADVGLEVAFVESDGWDTHNNQGSANGQLAGRLHDFSHAIAALHTDMGDRMSDVLLLTMSEFGRAARQNGNRGTDHGHGTCFFALGGHVNGGRVLGKWPGLAPEQLFEERDLAVTTDFRTVFAEVCAKYFGAGIEQLKAVFPNYRVQEEDFRGIVKG